MLPLNRAPTELREPERDGGAKAPMKESFGEDKSTSGHTLSSDARVWRSYVKEATDQDDEMILRWTQSMDALLVFSGLFSAALTAFLVEFYKLLQPDPQQLSIDILTDILRAVERGTSTNPPPQSGPGFQIPFIALWANRAWFASLAVTLADSLVIILIKQMLDGYRFNLRDGSLQEQAYRRQRRWDVIVRWRIPRLINFLPTLLHFALALFGVGLIAILWTINVTVAVPVCVIFSLTLIFYIVTTLWPLVHSLSCPFRSPLSFELIAVTCKVIYMSIYMFRPHRAPLALRHIPRRAEIERQAILKDTDRLTRSCIWWLVATSRDPKLVHSALDDAIGDPMFLGSLQSSLGISNRVYQDLERSARLRRIPPRARISDNAMKDKDRLQLLHEAVPYLHTWLLVVRQTALVRVHDATGEQPNTPDPAKFFPDQTLEHPEAWADLAHGWLRWLEVAPDDAGDWSLEDHGEARSLLRLENRSLEGLSLLASIHAYYLIILKKRPSIKLLLAALDVAGDSQELSVIRPLFDALALCITVNCDVDSQSGRIYSHLLRFLRKPELTHSPAAFNTLSLTVGLMGVKMTRPTQNQPFQSEDIRSYYFMNYQKTDIEEWRPRTITALRHLFLPGRDPSILHRVAEIILLIAQGTENLPHDDVVKLFACFRKAKKTKALTQLMGNFHCWHLFDTMAIIPDLLEIAKDTLYTDDIDIQMQLLKTIGDKWRFPAVIPRLSPSAVTPRRSLPTVIPEIVSLLLRHLGDITSSDPRVAQEAAVALVPGSQCDWYVLLGHEAVSSLVTFFDDTTEGDRSLQNAWGKWLETDIWTYSLDDKGEEAQRKLTKSFVGAMCRLKWLLQSDEFPEKKRLNLLDRVENWELPRNYLILRDRDDRKYYLDTKTNTTSWEPPEFTLGDVPSPNKRDSAGSETLDDLLEVEGWTRRGIVPLKE